MNGAKASGQKLTRAAFSALVTTTEAEEPTAAAAAAPVAEEEVAPEVVDVELAALPKIDGSEWVWRKAIHDGYVKDTAFAIATPELLSFEVSAPAARAEKTFEELKNGEYELTFFADSKVLDGRFANNGWLQEVPDFLTKLTWDNAAIFSPATAKKLGIQDEDLHHPARRRRRAESRSAGRSGTTYGLGFASHWLRSNACGLRGWIHRTGYRAASCWCGCSAPFV